MAIWDDLRKTTNFDHSITLEPVSFTHPPSPLHAAASQGPSRLAHTESTDTPQSSITKDKESDQESDLDDDEDPHTFAHTRTRDLSIIASSKTRTKTRQKPTSVRKYRTSYVFNPETDVPAPERVRRSSRSRKATSKVREMAHHAFKSFKNNRLSFTEQVDRLMALTALSNGEPNELDPHAFAASANPNILNHRNAMNADDSDKKRRSNLNKGAKP